MVGEMDLYQVAKLGGSESQRISHSLFTQIGSQNFDIMRTPERNRG